MRPRALFLVCPALLLLAVAWTLSGSRPPLPTGDEATAVMMAQSLWHDHDLAYRAADLDRAGRLWEGGPAGLTLFTDDGGRTLRYGGPVAYPLAALPFYAVAGVRGIALLNMALFLAMAFAAFTLTAGPRGPRKHRGGRCRPPLRRRLLLRLGGLRLCLPPGAHGLPDGLRLLPPFRLAASAAGGVGGDPIEDERRGLLALAGAGVLSGAALASFPLLALLALPVALDLAARRRWRPLAAFVAAALLAAGLLAGFQRAATGEWSPAGGVQRRAFAGEYPLESPRDLWQGYGAEGSPDLAAGLRLLPRNLGYLAAGRSTGLLPYFPFALFALALYLLGTLWGRNDRSRHLLAGALLLYALLVLLAHPHDFGGAAGFLGSRYLALVYPAFLFLPGLPGRLAARRSLALPYLAAGLWTVLAVLGSLSGHGDEEAAADLVASSHLFQRLPLELTLLPGDHLPGFYTRTWNDAVWLVPRGAFFAGERHPHGVWVRGATRSEVIVVSPRPLSRIAFTAWSLAPGNVLTVASGGERLTVRFDTDGKRNGTPVELALRPAARGLGFFPQPAGRPGRRGVLSPDLRRLGRPGARPRRPQEPGPALSRRLPRLHGRGAVGLKIGCACPIPRPPFHRTTSASTRSCDRSAPGSASAARSRPPSPAGERSGAAACSP